MPAMLSSTITPAQQRTLDGLFAAIEDAGYAPTLRELGDRIGLSSPKTVRQHLVALEKRGYIRRLAGSHRAIEILPVGLEQVSANRRAVERGCRELCDHCQPEAFHPCVLPTAHGGYHSCAVPS